MADPADKQSQQPNPAQKESRKSDVRKTDEDPVGKVYDSRLMRRLGCYLLPYGWQTIVSAISVQLHR